MGLPLLPSTSIRHSSRLTSKVSLFNIALRMDSFCSLSDRDGSDPRSAPSSADLTKTSPINNLVVVLVLLQPPITTVEAAVNASNDAVRGMVLY